MYNADFITLKNRVSTLEERVENLEETIESLKETIETLAAIVMSSRIITANITANMALLYLIRAELPLW